MRRRIKIKDSLFKKNPELAKEWHPKRNGTLTPEDVTACSNKKVWWVCSKGHEWNASIHNRYYGRGCPYCSGRRVCKDNCLATLNPKLAKEWHPIKNGVLTPWDVTAFSNKKVWWMCSKGHEWNASIPNRYNGRGCPYCGRKKVCEDNCLATVNPELAGEWHPEKNGTLTPKDVTPGSDKKVWWKCKKGHEWYVHIYLRNKGTGCPYCSGKKVCKDNCLAQVNPELAKEWHPEKNGNLTPEDVTSGSVKKVWWICAKGHEWNTSIDTRKRGAGCPYCRGKKVCKDNCLATKNPELAKEWHPEKNGNLTPEDVTAGSGKVVWWKCFYGHEWQDIINVRRRGKICPACKIKLKREGFYSYSNTSAIHIRRRK